MGDFFAAIWAFFGGPNPPPSPPPAPKPAYVVKLQTLSDQKSVFATVEPRTTVPARARIGGVLVALTVHEGDKVEKGQVIGAIGDKKLALQAGSYQAQISAAHAEYVQAKSDYERAERLMKENAIARSNYDKAKAAYDVARANERALTAQKDVVLQQASEGSVVAPTAGRVITVPLTVGSVVASGETVATVAEQNFVLRLKLPETHAHALKVGAPVQLDGKDIGLDGVRSGTIMLVYPDIESGHVVADAEVPGLKDYFVGERVRVMVPVGTRKSILVPEALIETRAGIDYAKILGPKNHVLLIPVQRGILHPEKKGKAALEILSGLHPGDRMLKP